MKKNNRNNKQKRKHLAIALEKLGKKVGFVFRSPIPALEDIKKMFTYKENDNYIFMKEECLKELNRAKDSTTLMIESINHKIGRISVSKLKNDTFRKMREQYFLKEKRQNEININILSKYIKTIEQSK